MKYLTEGSYLYFVPLLLMFLASAGACSRDSGERAERKSERISEIMNEISADSIEANIRTLVNFHTRHSASEAASDSTGVSAARRWIRQKLRAYSRRNEGRMRVDMERFRQKRGGELRETAEIVNVMGVLPGTQLESRDRLYLVGGHYDSRVSSLHDDTSYAPGANDNASGTAAVLELARVLSAYEFDATLVFVAFGGKEHGLLGSSRLAREVRRRKVNIAAMFNNDIIGSPADIEGNMHDNSVRIFAGGIPPERELSRYHRRLLGAGGENDTPSRNLARFVREISEMYMDDFTVDMIYRGDPYLREGDHSPFLKRGYPAIRFSEPREDFRRIHQDVRVEEGVQYGDLPEFVDFDYIGKVTRLNAASLATLANAPARPRNVEMIATELSNHTTLSWGSSGEPDLRGFEVVWRESTSPYWEHSEFAGDTTRYTIENTPKDNFLFGVRAVDRYGYRSPAVFPLPERQAHPSIR